MLRRLSSRSEFAGFLVAGGLAAVANVCSRWLIGHVASYPVAIVAAYGIGMLTAFVLMREQVFESRGRGLAWEIGAFVAINALALVQTLLVSLALAYYVLPRFGIVQHAETIAHLVGVIAPMLTSYYGHKHLTFGQ